MASSGQKRGACENVWPLLTSTVGVHVVREKGQGNDPCVKNLDGNFKLNYQPPPTKLEKK